MSTMVQIRNVPEELVRELKARAAAQRTSLSEFLLARLEELVAEPPIHEVLARLNERPRRDLGAAAAELLDEVRAG